jgi:oligopeptide transport system substrate-binding protein
MPLRAAGKLRPSILVLVSVVLALSCAEKPQQEESVERETLKVTLLKEIEGFDPVNVRDVVSALVASQVFEGLLFFDPVDRELKPAVAESWTVSKEGLEWTFHIRRDVCFQDDPCFQGGKGRTVRAEDVKFSLLRSLKHRFDEGGDPIVAAPIRGLKAFLNGSTETVEGIELPDQETVIFRLDRYSVAFPYLLAGPLGWVVPAEAVQYYGAKLNGHPVGTGPFRFLRWDPLLGITLLRNPRYWETDKDGNRLPYLGRLDFKYDFRSLKSLFWEGEIDVMPVVRPSMVPVSASQTGKNPWTFQFLETNRLNTIWLAFKMDRDSVWTKKRVLRQALNYFPEHLREEAASWHLRAGSLLPPGILGYAPDVRRFSCSPERGLALLKEAGFPNGKNLPPLRAVVSARSESSAWERLKSELARYNIRFTYQTVPGEKFASACKTGDFDLVRAGWVADYPEAIDFFQCFYSRSLLNTSCYLNAEFDKLYEEAMACPDRDRRFTLCKEMEEIILADAPAVFLWHDRERLIVKSCVKNYGPSVNPFGQAVFKLVRVER